MIAAFNPNSAGVAINVDAGVIHFCGDDRFAGRENRTLFFPIITDDRYRIANTGIIYDNLGNVKGATIAFIFFMTESFCWARCEAQAEDG